MLDRDDIVRTNDRRVKIRALHRFEQEKAPLRQLEREFALTALEMMRCQPAMAEVAGVFAAPEPKACRRPQTTWPAASVEQARDC